jgi:hypothetical protein
MEPALVHTVTCGTVTNEIEAIAECALEHRAEVSQRQPSSPRDALPHGQTSQEDTEFESDVFFAWPGLTSVQGISHAQIA